MASDYYYRGTTEGWPGNECLQDQRITCATTDPIVATLFAIECRSHGRSVILMAPTSSFAGREGPVNHKSVQECAVNLLLEPIRFAAMSVKSLDVDRSLEILAGLGHDWPPPRLNGRSALRKALDESSFANLRLDLDRIRTYNRLALEA